MMQPFNQAELAFLEETRAAARMATVGPDGTPQVTPVEWSLSVDRQALELHAADVPPAGPAAVVIDEADASGPSRGIEVRGTAEAPDDSTHLIRIHPGWITAWGFDGAGGVRDVSSEPDEAGSDREDAASGPLHAVLRRSAYDLEALAGAGAQLAEFERTHAAQPGYAGNVVVDLGEGERFTITLWASEQHAAAARAALSPVVQALLSPLERSPSQLLGVGPVITTDLTLATRPAER